MIIIPVYKTQKVDPYLAQQMQKMTERLILLHNKNEIVRQGGRFELKNAYERENLIKKVFGNTNTIRLESIEETMDGNLLNENIFDSIGEFLEKNDPNRTKREFTNKVNQYKDLVDQRSAKELYDAIDAMNKTSEKVKYYEDVIKKGKHDDGTPLTQEDLIEINNLKDNEMKKLQSYKNNINSYNLWKKEVKENKEELDTYKELMDIEYRIKQDYRAKTDQLQRSTQYLQGTLASLLKGAIKATAGVAKGTYNLAKQAEEKRKLERTFSFGRQDYNSIDEPTTLEIRNPKFGDFQLSIKAIVIDSNIDKLQDLFKKDLRGDMLKGISGYFKTLIRRYKPTWEKITGIKDFNTRNTDQEVQYFLNGNYQAQIFDVSDLGYDFDPMGISFNDVQKLQRLGWKYVYITDFTKNQVWAMISYAPNKQYSNIIDMDNLKRFYKYRTKEEQTFEELAKEMKKLL